MKKYFKFINIVIYGLLLSSIIAIFAVLFMSVESYFSHFLWFTMLNKIPNRVAYIVLLCIVGGSIVSVMTLKWSGIPRTTHRALDELKRTNRVDYRFFYRTVIASIIILSFGAGVGPEATLLGVIIELSIWQADKIRYLFFNYEELKGLSFFKIIYRLIIPNSYYLHYNEEHALKDKNSLRIKKFLKSIFIINGIMVFMILSKYTDNGSFIIKLGETNYSYKDLWAVIPIWVLGLACGYICNYILKYIDKIFFYIKEKKVICVFLGAISIGIIGIFKPLLLFSGQHSMTKVIEIGMNETIVTITILSIAKLIFLKICINSGWIGGEIFPFIFASLLEGFAVASIIPNIDSILIVAIFSIGMATMLQGSAIVIGLFLMLFFPYKLWPIIIFIIITHEIFCRKVLTKFRIKIRNT